MRSRDRILAVLFVLLVISLFKVGQQLYRFVVYRAERVEIARLEFEVDDVGYGVIATQLRADTLRRAIERADSGLTAVRQELNRMERTILAGTVTGSLAATYRERLTAYNEAVNQRNRMLDEWQAVVDSNHFYVDRYNLLVDSIRRMATVMGEPYYPVPTPAEIAIRRQEAAPASN